MEKILERKDVNPKDTWNLELIYSSTDLLYKDLETIRQALPGFASFKGELVSASKIAELFKKEEEVGRMISRAFTYASNRSNEDVGNQANQALLQEVRKLYSQFSELTSFEEPEILSLSSEKLQEIKESSELCEYKFHFEKLIAMKEHVLSGDKEEAYASLGEVRNAPQSAYSVLTNSEFRFPDVMDGEGNMLPLTQGTYGTYIKSPDRILRKNAFTALHETYGSYGNTLGTLLTASMEDWNVQARVRKYEKPFEMNLKRNNIPYSVFTNSLDTINSHLDLMHRYVDIKKKALKLDEIHFYDLYADLTGKEDKKYTFEEGVEMALEGLKPMGEEYLGIFRKGIEDRWIDRYENKGKRSGAYSSGAYETQPYILLNYKGTLGDVSTLVHEMGHSMHSYYTRNFQPYIYGHYSIFLAEVASTCNEQLLIHQLIENTDDKNLKLYLISQELEKIRTTVYRQLMFAEFENITHNALSEGKPMTSKEYCDIYLELNRRYFGEGIVPDDEIKWEWSRIPHFYTDFYVYQYATGYAAASSFARMILNEGEEAAKRYIERFLKAGSSKYPVDVLKDAGVDVTTPKPLEDTLKTFGELLGEFKKELGL